MPSETLRDPGEIQSLVFYYEKAAGVLREAYLQEWNIECPSTVAIDSIKALARMQTTCFVCAA